MDKLPDKYVYIDILGWNVVSSSMSAADSLVAYSTWEAAVVVRNFITDSIIFKQRVPDICYAAPALHGDLLFTPVSFGDFACINYRKHTTLWTCHCPNGGTWSYFTFANDSLIIANVKNYGIIALNGRTGEKVYEILVDKKDPHFITDLSPYPLTVDSDRLYISNWSGGYDDVAAFNIADGTSRWKKRFDSSYYAGESVIKGKYLFVGLNGYYKYGATALLNKYTGSTYAKNDFNYCDRRPARTNDSLIFYSSFEYENGKEYLFSFNVNSLKTDTIYGFDSAVQMVGVEFYLLDSIIFYAGRVNKLYYLSVHERKLKSYTLDNPALYLVHKYRGRWYLFG